MVIPLVLMSLFVFAFLVAFCLSNKRYLVTLYVVCYSVPFFGLVSCLWSDTVMLWPVGGFEYHLDDVIVYRLSVVWFSGVLGGLFACLFSFLFRGASFSLYKGAIFSSGDFRLGGVLFLIVSLFFILFRIVSHEKMLGVFPGVESLVVFSIVAFCALSLAYPSRKLFLLSVLLVVSYCVANAITGDRDFVVLFVAYVLGCMFRYKDFIKLKALLLVTALMMVLLVFGVFVSMSRMEVDLSSDNVTQFFLYNSWNAIILPLVEQVSLYWNGSHMRYGQTYLDMMLSLAPSPIYSFMGVEKPILIDNPAMWYYIEGLGGIHVAGVAFENFGLIGVILNGFLSFFLVRVIDSHCQESDYLRFLIYMLCAASLMHWIWYGEIYLLNAMVFYVMAVALFFLMRLIRLLK